MLLAALLNWRENRRSSDAALMAQLAGRQEAALGQLYDRYARTVFALAFRITGHAATAEEIVQDVFLLLWRNAQQYQASRGSLEAWLLTLARNRSLDQLRAKSERQRRREDAMENFPLETFIAIPNKGPEGDPQEWIDQRARATRVRALVAALPQAQRRAIELAYFDGLSHSEIAELLKEPLGTVKTWIRSALSRLRQELGEEC